MVKYVVEQKFYDNGKIRTVIKKMSKKDAERLSKSAFTDEFDLYNDIFDTLEDARKFRRDVFWA